MNPTPWMARRDDSGGEAGLWSVVDAKGGIVFFGMSEKISRLIAGAPDLDEALKDAREFVKTFGGDLTAIDAALAKAATTGRPT